MRQRIRMAITVIALLNAVALASCAGKSTAKVAGPATQVRSLKPPATGRINVAFVISENANVMDIAGPWEVFQDAMITPKGQPWREGEHMVMPFNPYTVSDSLKPVSATDGLSMIPNYTFENAPKPQVIVIPAQGGRTEAQKSWLLANSRNADVTMSVCTGASMLAAYGLLDSQTATTHHLYLQTFQKRFPSVHFVSGTRFVENEKVSTAGGLTSGIDLALHVVERYYGREVAQSAADFMEYRSELWKNPDLGDIKAVVPAK
jgi:transcriptional regulator GlxA family with amidase domain